MYQMMAPWSVFICSATNINTLTSSPVKPTTSYMVDNSHNYWNAAPDQGKHPLLWTTCHRQIMVFYYNVLILLGTQNGAVWQYSGSFENYMSNLHSNFSHSQYNRTHWRRNYSPIYGRNLSTQNVQDAGYWLTELGPAGKVRTKVLISLNK